MYVDVQEEQKETYRLPEETEPPIILIGVAKGQSFHRLGRWSAPYPPLIGETIHIGKMEHHRDEGWYKVVKIYHKITAPERPYNKVFTFVIVQPTGRE